MGPRERHATRARPALATADRRPRDERSRRDQPLVGRRPQIGGHVATLGMVVAILAVAAGCAHLPASPTSGGSAAGALAAGPSSPAPVASSAAADVGAALRVVEAFEHERADGPRAVAWARLAPRT